jgi:tetratricopeptide (TPR) repeat protein
MESITRGMRRLQADAAWFARATELRLLHVSTTADLGAPAIKLCAGQEYHADNKSLYFVLDEPYLAASDGWYSRGQSLRKQYAAKREGLAKEGIALAELGPAVKRSPAASEFTDLLKEASKALSPPISGLVIVLAPKQVEPGAPFAAEVRSMINSTLLSQVRWIVIERDLFVARELAHELGDRALSSEWRRDDDESKKDLKAMIGPIDPSLGLNFAPKMPAWQAPGAGPDVEAPPRKNAPPPAPPDPALLASAGLTPEFVMGGGQALQKLVLGGALAQKEGRHADAIGLQGAAVELCGRLGMVKAQIINTLILGSYFMAAESRPHARKTYEQAAAQASQHQLKDEEAQANLSLGMLDALEGQNQQSMGRYTNAAELAEKSGNQPLAIESWRTAGQLAYGLKAYDAALQSWLRGLKVTAGMKPKDVQATSAAEMSRGTAAILRSRGQSAEAQEFEQRAFRYEHGLEPNAPIPPS